MKLTQKELANKLGISQAAIHRIESSDSLPNLETAFKISKALNTDVYYLFSDDEEYTSFGVYFKDQATANKVIDDVKRKK